MVKQFQMERKLETSRSPEGPFPGHIQNDHVPRQTLSQAPTGHFCLFTNRHSPNQAKEQSCPMWTLQGHCPQPVSLSFVSSQQYIWGKGGRDEMEKGSDELKETREDLWLFFMFN